VSFEQESPENARLEWTDQVFNHLFFIPLAYILVEVGLAGIAGKNTKDCRQLDTV